jgi:GTP1/Obg family GTP-binding protein
LKISGEAQKHQETKIGKGYVRRTNIRMKVAAQAAHSRDMLESYLKSVNDETMTVQEIGKLYDELIKLVALNKDMKKIYGSKMKKA